MDVKLTLTQEQTNHLLFCVSEAYHYFSEACNEGEDTCCEWAAEARKLFVSIEESLESIGGKYVPPTTERR